MIHSDESAETTSNAEAVARYFQTIGRKASAHKVVDDNSVVTCVSDDDTAFHAPGVNHDGLGLEHAGYARQTRDEWLDDYGKAMLALSAKVVAAWCRKYSIPVVKLSASDLTKGKKGICGHLDVTAAYGLSTHTDPGFGFPWDYYLGLVKAELNDEDEMDQATFTKYLTSALADKNVQKLVADSVWNDEMENPAKPGVFQSASSFLRYTDVLHNQTRDAIVSAVKTLLGK